MQRFIRVRYRYGMVGVYTGKVFVRLARIGLNFCRGGAVVRLQGYVIKSGTKVFGRGMKKVGRFPRSSIKVSKSQGIEYHYFF